MPRANWEFVSRLKISIPPLSEQRAIAHILGTLDDKIELNRRMNETLEAIARAIFKSWFVDFDPVIDNALKAGKPIPDELAEKAARRREVLVRAHAEGRPAGLPEHLARLFPDEFVESELGWVPKGWSITPVGKLFKVIGGSTPSTKEEKYWKNGIFYWATPKDLSSLTAPILLSTERKITQAGLSQISSGLLPPGTVLMSSRAPIGYLAISAIPLAINQGIIAIICNELISNYYMLNWCYWNMENIKQHASGTTFEEINKVVFRSIPIIIPHQSLVRYYTNIVKPFYQKIQQNLEQSYTLTTIRDTLLPKLISGKLRVKDAEKLGGKEV